MRGEGGGGGGGGRDVGVNKWQLRYEYTSRCCMQILLRNIQYLYVCVYKKTSQTSFTSTNNKYYLSIPDATKR